MPRKSKGEKVDHVTFVVYEGEAAEWARALHLVGYENEKRKTKFLWRLVRAGVKALEQQKHEAEHKAKSEMDELKERTTATVEKIAASANRTPINLSHENGQIDLEEAIEETAAESTLDPEIAETTTQFAADDPLTIPPWLNRNYKDWSEEELFDKIAELESIERDTNEEIELKKLNRELESRTA